MRESGVGLQVRQLGETPYLDAWEMQRLLAEDRATGLGPDVVMLVTHPSVYTAGKRTKPSDRPTDGSEVIEVDRGGRITWHGPGQLVGYPIVKLAEPIDVIAYVRLLEQALIGACTEVGLPSAGRVPGRSGVWLAETSTRPERKVAAIGVRITHGVSMHGFALNCDPDLSAFERIVPCGIPDAGVTSLTSEIGRHVTVDELRPIVERWLRRALSGGLPIEDGALARHRTEPVQARRELHPVLL